MATAFPKWLKNNGAPVIAGLVAVAIVALLQVAALPAFERIGLSLFDSYQRAAPRTAEQAPVRVIDNDDESIRRLGQWPWPRTDIAKLAQQLAAAGASVIAFDIVFAEPDRTSPARLTERMRREGEPTSAVMHRLERSSPGSSDSAHVLLGVAVDMSEWKWVK